MRNWFKFLTFSLMCVTVASLCFAAKPKQKVPRVPKPEVKVNIQAVMDSALIMADDYATALEQKPELAGTRLNILSNYYDHIPTAAAKDSVRSTIFSFYVDYMESGKIAQADAFKKCFIHLAPDTDEHLGPLYANDLVLAREQFDTIAVKEGIQRLDNYAKRMNVDWDAELNEARDFLHTIRTRPHINDLLPGVWVSDFIDSYTPSYNGNKDEEGLIESLCILKIRDLGKVDMAFLEDNAKMSSIFFSGDSINRDFIKNNFSGEHNLDAIKIKGYTRKAGTTIWGDSYGYIPVIPTFSTCFGLETSEKDIAESPVSSAQGWEMASVKQFSRTFQTDNDAYAAYAFWGDERMKVPDAEIGAIIRQTTQQIQANVAGHFSRSKYDFGDRFAANLVSGAVSAGINAAVDAMMVSTDKIWAINLLLIPENQNKIKAKVSAQLVKSKSNSSEVKDYRYDREFYYYRWEPQDSVYFLGKHFIMCDHYDGIISYYNFPKEKEKKLKDSIKVYSKEWNNWFKKRKEELKAEIKAMPKGEARKAAQKRFDEDVAKTYMWCHVNKQQLEKLKKKADQ